MAIFQEPSYRRLWASGLCVNVVRWIDLVTLGWLALELTGSPFMVGLAAFARSAPMMVVGPFAGIVADRVPRGHVLLVTQSAGAATALVLAMLFASGAGVLASPVILVAFASSRWLPVCLALLVVIGAAESAFATMQSTVVLLSAPERVRGGTMGILSACIGTQPLGTLAIGLLAGSIGAPRTFTVNAIIALAVIVPLAVPLVRRRP